MSKLKHTQEVWIKGYYSNAHEDIGYGEVTIRPCLGQACDYVDVILEKEQIYIKNEEGQIVPYTLG